MESGNNRKNKGQIRDEKLNRKQHLWENSAWIRTDRRNSYRGHSRYSAAGWDTDSGNLLLLLSKGHVRREGWKISVSGGCFGQLWIKIVQIISQWRIKIGMVIKDGLFSMFRRLYSANCVQKKMMFQNCLMHNLSSMEGTLFTFKFCWNYNLSKIWFFFLLVGLVLQKNLFFSKQIFLQNWSSFSVF